MARVLRLKRNHYHIDGKPFDLTSRPAMRAIYEALPCTREEAFRMQVTLRKCAQVGFTAMEMLYAIYICLLYTSPSPRD